jgi:hypothetical protein
VTFEILYTDLTRWRGEDVAKSPDRDVLILWVEPVPGQRVQVSGWDHYGVSYLPDRTRVVRWKDAESYDRDGSLDPHAGQGAYQEWAPDGTLIMSGKYVPLSRLPSSEIVRHGRWVDDGVAREAGIL